MNKALVLLAIVSTLAVSVPLFSAIEKWVIPVTAQIDLMLNITPHEINFGTIFAQETLNKTLTIGLSESFINRTDLDDIIYSVCVEDEAGGQNLTQLLTFSKHPEIGEIDLSCPGNSTLRKSTGDFYDNWIVNVEVPHIFVYANNQPLLCRDDITDQSCDEPEQDAFGNNKTVGLYTAKIQIEVLEVSKTNVTELGEIHGMKFNDTNNDGIKNIGEIGLSGWNITLTAPNGSMFWILTDSNGEYSFTGLTNGVYPLAEVLKPGWNKTLSPLPVNIINGTNSVGNDFGNFKLPPCTNVTSIPNISIKLVLDTSGSMSDSFGSGTRASTLQNATRGFIDKIPNSPIINYTNKWWVGVDEFGTTVVQRIGLTPIGNAANKTLIKNAVTGSAFGWTNISGAIDVGAKQLNSSSRFNQPNMTSYLILISDGEPTAGYSSSCNFNQVPACMAEATTAANNAKSQGIVIVTAGIALTNSTATFMKSLATSNSTFINAATANDLAAFFENLLSTICQ